MTRDPSDGSVRGCIPCEGGHKPQSDGVHRMNGHETECVAERLGRLIVDQGRERMGLDPLPPASGLPFSSTKPENVQRLSREWLEYMFHRTEEPAKAAERSSENGEGRNMSELPTFKAVKPIATCEACGHELYPHSTPNICDYRQDCSMHGEEWMQYQAARKMQNAYR